VGYSQVRTSLFIDQINGEASGSSSGASYGAGIGVLNSENVSISAEYIRLIDAQEFFMDGFTINLEFPFK